MNQFLGFVVLTGPLFLIVLWVPVCIALAFLVGKKFIKKSMSLKIIGGMVVFLVALPLPLADEIAGRMYFNHLCETEAGVKVYQTIELPAEYWDKEGEPTFYDKKTGNFSLPPDKYYNIRSEKIVRQFGVEENLASILDIDTNRIIGEKILFRYWGRYVSKNFNNHISAIRCGGDWNEFVERQFTQTMERGGG